MTRAIVTAKDLSRHYNVKGALFGPKQVVRALSEASFELYPGKTLAVVGESGCGKSTLARLITLIEEPTAGTFTIDGTPATPANWAGLRKSVQIIFQDPYGSLNPRHRVGAILEEPLRINRPDMSREAITAKARGMLELVGLRAEHFDRYPHMFSGGQRQRIAVVKHMADDIIVMYLGRPVESGTIEDVLTNPRHPYTRALLSATPVADPTAEKQRIKLEGELPSPLNVPPGCAFAPRCWKAQDRCRKERPTLDGSDHPAACFFPEGD